MPCDILDLFYNNLGKEWVKVEMIQDQEYIDNCWRCLCTLDSLTIISTFVWFKVIVIKKKKKLKEVLLLSKTWVYLLLKTSTPNSKCSEFKTQKWIKDARLQFIRQSSAFETTMSTLKYAYWSEPDIEINNPGIL